MVSAFGGTDGGSVIIVEVGVEEGAPVVDPTAHSRQIVPDVE